MVIKRLAEKRVLELMEEGIPPDERQQEYPTNLVEPLIAIALSCNPKLLLADEPQPPSMLQFRPDPILWSNKPGTWNKYYSCDP